MSIPLNSTIQTLCQTYYSQSPDEISRGQDFLKFLAEEKEYFARNNFRGHITVSGFVLNPERNALLLIHHKQLQRYLQPGGHFEKDASLIEGALREVAEEVGIFPQQLITLDSETIPFDIDPHVIPANAKKAEPQHTHFDCRYLFGLSSNADITLAQNEVSGYKWLALTDTQLPIYLGELVVKKIRKIVKTL